MNTRFLNSGALLAATLLFLMPGTSFAAKAWSKVTVDQRQRVWTPTPMPRPAVDPSQSATIYTSVQLGDQAYATSATQGSQNAVVNGSLRQRQVLGASSSLSWPTNTWPAQATAHTGGKLYQTQVGQSATPMYFTQSGGIAQESRVGDTISRGGTDNVTQTLDGVGPNASQSQRVRGQTFAQGWINPPLPPCVSWCDSVNLFGGKLLQSVHVFVQNALEF